MYRRILLPLNLQEAAPGTDALEVALDLARRDRAEMFVIEVLAGYGSPLVASFFPPAAQQEAVRETGERLAEFVAANIPAAIKATTLVREGRPYEQILAAADDLGIDLIVIQSQRLGRARGVLLGSTAEKVVRHAHCSVIVVRDRPVK